MRCRFLLFCFGMVCCASVYAQRTISGTVVHAGTGEMIAGSSVFINGTSIGTVSDQTGQFVLNHIPDGHYELIVSSIGYETNLFAFHAGQLPLRVKVEMRLKIKELDNVTVEPFEEETWAKWGRIFKGYFLGETPNAKQCKIRNEQAVKFRWYAKSNRLVAYADEPLVVENRALGYLIRFQLEDFELNFQAHTSMYAGYPYFEEMYKNGKSIPRRWERARLKAYQGSMLHFMRSLYHDRLLDEGFEVRRMVRTPNTEKERIKQIYQRKRVNLFAGGVKVESSGPDKLSPDSVSYYEKVISERDYTDTYSNAMQRADSICSKAENGMRLILFPDYLHVTYKRELEDQTYLSFYRESRSPAWQQSSIWMINQQPVLLDENGSYYPPQEIFSMGYWSWSENISSLLPSNYDPAGF